MNAGDIGSSKPSPIAFISIVQCMNIIPSRILMVGDNYNHDIIGNNISSFFLIIKITL